jgi:hypothetical protein
LLRLYPRRWRARYGAEFEDLLFTGQSGLRTIANVVWSAMHERINPTPGLAMDNDVRVSRFESWCAKAPWAMFVVAPMFLLAASHFVACMILWSGWRMFLPDMDTPFVRIHGAAVFYFGVGRMLYYTSPLLIGWVVGIVAVRRRMKLIWPIASLSLIALIAATAQVKTFAHVPGQAGNVRIDLTILHGGYAVSSALESALAILFWLALPALIWRIYTGRFTHS